MNYAIKVGRIAVRNGPVSTPAAPTGLYIDTYEFINPSTVNLRLKWSHTADSLYYYNVYRRNPDNTLSYLGGTPNNAYFVPSLERIDSESTTVIEVEAVALDFGHSSHATTVFDWSLGVAESGRALPHYALIEKGPTVFRGQMHFTVFLFQPGAIQVSLFNVSGQKVATLADEKHGAGTHEITWQATNQRGQALAAGVYFINVTYKSTEGAAESIMQKVIFLK